MEEIKSLILFQMSCHEDPIFSGGVCRPEPATGCTCSEEQTRIPDPYNYRMYLECRPQPRIQACQIHEEFDPKTKECKTRPVAPPCTNLGVFPNINDCRWYQICRWEPEINNFYSSQVRCLKPDHYFSIGHRTCIRGKDMLATDPCAKTFVKELRQNEEKDQLVEEKPSINSTTNQTLIDQVDNFKSVEEENEVEQETRFALAPKIGYLNDPVSSDNEIKSDFNDSSEIVEAKSTPSRSYACPASVYLFVYWLPSLANYACSTS